MTDQTRDKIFAAIKAQCEESKRPVTASITLFKITPPIVIPDWMESTAHKHGIFMRGMNLVEKTIVFDLIQK